MSDDEGPTAYADRWQREELIRVMAVEWFGQWLRSGRGSPSEHSSLVSLFYRAKELWELSHPREAKK